MPGACHGKINVCHIVGALLLTVGVLPHRVRQNAHFGLFLDCMPISECATVIIVGLDGSHFPISLHKTFVFNALFCLD